MKQLAALAAILFLAACHKDDNNNTTLNDYDQFFIQQAAYVNLNEVSASGIAATNAFSDSVISFAHTMIIDHTQARSALDSIATAFNIQLPTTPDTAHASFNLQLQGLSVFVFDTTYIGAQIRDHNNAVVLFNSELALGNNQQLKNYASQNVPLEQAHLQEAESIQAMLH
jgi:putative membrane protein